ncbi:excalibur calcium-binding domain-containing protein [Pontivivens ytuae]|uniref:excalibur calcium-binding domain-containing protein n=1 Tax=Pontivivens ytuae TaxID=2789856 RepID=UPI001E42E557|nr:excalibur calcium-binding domain-containing protein [Pontivivens ytuae]
MVRAALLATLLAGPALAQGADRDCADFPDWESAQRFYLQNGGLARDPHRLDRDRDGIACVSLPGAPRR